MPTDEKRLSDLYDRHSRAVHAYCVRRIGRDEAGDLVARVFTVAWRRIDAVPADEMALPWLYGVARRVVSEHHRSRSRQRRLRRKLSGVRLGDPTQPDTQVVQRAEYHQVHEALAALRKQDREILLLAAWEELSNSQIAAVLGCSTEAAAQRIHRAKQKLGRAFRALSTGESPRIATDGSEMT